MTSFVDRQMKQTSFLQQKLITLNVAWTVITQSNDVFSIDRQMTTIRHKMDK